MQKFIRFRWKLTEKSISKVDYFFTHVANFAIVQCIWIEFNLQFQLNWNVGTIVKCNTIHGALSWHVIPVLWLNCLRRQFASFHFFVSLYLHIFIFLCLCIFVSLMTIFDDNFQIFKKKSDFWKKFRFSENLVIDTWHLRHWLVITLLTIENNNINNYFVTFE